MEIKSKMMKEFQTYINAMTKDLMAKYEASLDSILSTSDSSSVEAKEVKKSPAKKAPAKKEVKKEEDEPASVDAKEVKKSPKRSPKKATKEEISIPFEESQSALISANKTQLTAWCKKYGLKCTGNVTELMARLVDYKKEHPPATAEEETEESEKKPTPVKTLLSRGGLLSGMKTTSKKPVPTQPPVVKKLLASAPLHKLARNKFGNFEHTETKLVFDKDDKIVIGKQDPGGDILDLTDEDIEICKQFKFNYRLPENLDVHKKGLKHVKVAEVEEELNEEDIEGDYSEDDGAEEDEFVDEE